MNLFRKNEKALVKSLIYGLIGGFYFSILVIPRIETIESGEGWRTFNELSIFEYVVKVLQVSIAISIGTLIVVLLYLFFKRK